MMAPTEILGQPAFQYNLTQILIDQDIPAGLLTGSTKPAERKKLHAGLRDGSIKLLIGTHL
jgi:ATP-dependent DNA helicase RecG